MRLVKFQTHHNEWYISFPQNLWIYQWIEKNIFSIGKNRILNPLGILSLPQNIWLYESPWPLAPIGIAFFFFFTFESTKIESSLFSGCSTIVTDLINSFRIYVSHIHLYIRFPEYCNKNWFQQKNVITWLNLSYSWR